MKYAVKDPKQTALYRGKIDECTGLEILAVGERVTLDASRDAVKRWCALKRFSLTREVYDKPTKRTFFYTNARRFFIHDARRNMLLSD